MSPAPREYSGAGVLLVRGERQAFVLAFADGHVRELRELSPQEVRHDAHLFGGIGAHDAGGRASARDAHGAHRRRHEQRQDHDRDEQFDERES
jgi:hypothetical protein